MIIINEKSTITENMKLVGAQYTNRERSPITEELLQQRLYLYKIHGLGRQTPVGGFEIFHNLDFLDLCTSSISIGDDLEAIQAGKDRPWAGSMAENNRY